MKLLVYILFTLALSAQCSQFPRHTGKRTDLLSLIKLVQNSLQHNAQNFLATQNINEENINSDNLDDTDASVSVMEQYYYGTWTSANSNYGHQFGDFSQNSGYAAFTTQDDSSDGIDDDIYFWFYDGQYVDQKVGIIHLEYDNSTDFNVSNSTFKNDSVSFMLYMRDDLHKGSVQKCTGGYQLSIFDLGNDNQAYNQTGGNFANAAAYFFLNSSDCNVNIQAVVAVRNAMAESKMLDYSLMVTLVCLAQLYATVKIIKNISQNDYDGSRYSLVTLSLFAIWDVFMCLFHLFEALTIQAFFHYLITPAFWYFILASIFETRLILIVWRTRYYQLFSTLREVRRGITVFYLKFYGAMISLLLLAYSFVPSTGFLSATCLFFVPQIIHNALRGQKYKFDYVYIFLLGFLRIATPLYVRACPDSIFKLTPSYTFLELYVGAVIFQILFLYLQGKFGSRFFIPRCFLPPKYNYFAKLSLIESSEEADTCSICMENLNEAVVSSETNQSTLLKHVTVMVTPCRHKFHPTCLRQWMEVKLECPFCRSPVPPIE